MVALGTVRVTVPTVTVMMTGCIAGPGIKLTMTFGFKFHVSSLFQVAVSPGRSGWPDSDSETSLSSESGSAQ